MADIIQTSLYRESDFVQVTVSTLGDTNSLVFQAGSNQMLVIENVTALPITPVITGLSAPDDFNVVGLGEIDLSNGYSLPSIPAGESRALPLQNIHRWLKGDVTVTGAAGAKAYITTQSTAPQYEPLWIQGGRLVASGRLTVNSKLWG